MLFFPLFDVFLSNPEEYSKEQILKKLEALPADEELKRRVISGFSNSTQESFVEYYKKLEDEEMRSFVVKDDSEFNLLGEDLQLMLSRMRYLYRSDTDDYGHAVSIGESSDFSCALRLMHIWQNSLYHESDAFIERKMNSMDSEKEIHASHKIPEVYCEFLLKAIPDLLSPSSLSSFEMVGSSFTPIQRLYSFEDRSSFVSTIKKYIALSRTVEQNSASEEKRKRVQEKRTAFLNGGSDRISMLEASEYLGVEYEPGSFTNKWLDRLGIASRLIIQEDVDGLGFKLFLEKKNSKKRSNLADEGHGITQLISILLNIECGIMLVEINRASGLYGEEEDWFDFAGFNPAVLALEEPEVSLHPCMQSKLADLFEDASKHGVHLIIETHSEYLVRKTQVLVSHLEDKSKNPFAVYYFTEKGNAYELGYSDSGRFIKSFGTGFLDEARNLAMEVFLRES